MIIFGVVDKRSCSKLSRLVLVVCLEWIRTIFTKSLLKNGNKLRGEGNFGY